MRNPILLVCCTSIIAMTSCIQTQTFDNINGMELTYKYENWNSYHVKFLEEGMYYQFLSGSKPDKWWGPFPYKMYVTDHGEYLISWYEEGYGDYITLLVNLEKKKLFGTGVVYAKDGVMTTFKEAKISQIVLPE